LINQITHESHATNPFIDNQTTDTLNVMKPFINQTTHESHAINTFIKPLMNHMLQTHSSINQLTNHMI